MAENASNTIGGDIEYYDFVVIGGGIAGASLGAEVARESGGNVAVLEQEKIPGYHTTGRSAAFFLGGYGNKVIRILTEASRDFMGSPPQWLTREGTLLKEIGALFVARRKQIRQLLGLFNEVREAQRTQCGEEKVTLEDEDFARKKIPLLKKGHTALCMWEPTAAQIDVTRLFSGYLAEIKRLRGTLKTNQKVIGVKRSNDGAWEITTQDTRIKAKMIINAAGAWADEVAAMAGAKKIGLKPKIRTICILSAPEGVDVKKWPLVIDVNEKFYFTPDGNRLLVSPADETPSGPHDVRPDERAVATGIDRMQRVIDFPVTHLAAKLAGLRSFVQDRTPVVGFDDHIPDFFWFAGQGGYGIQMAPALARYGAGLICERMPLDLKRLSPEFLHPRRLQK